MRIPSGVTDQYIYFIAVDATDFATRETGITLANLSCYRSRNNGTATAFTLPTFAEIDATNMPGVYSLLLDEDMTIAAGHDSEEMVFHIKDSGGVMSPVTRTIEIYRPKITAGNTLGVAGDGDISGNLDGTVATVTTLTGHTAQTGDSYARIGAAGAGLTGITGAALSTAGILAIWHQLTSAIVTASTIGKLLKDNINATISSAATATGFATSAKQNTMETTLNATATATALATAQTDLDTITGADGATLATAAVDNIWDEDIVAAHTTADTAGAILSNILPEKNAIFSNLEFLWVASSDHVTPVTGATGTSVTRSIDGGAFGTGTGTLAEVGSGIYQYDASAADMNGTVITFRFAATGGTPGAPDDAFVTVVTSG